MVAVDKKKENTSRRCQQSVVEMGDKVGAASKKYCPELRKWFLELSVSAFLVGILVLVLLIIIIILDAKGILKVTLKDSKGKDTGKRISDAAYESMDPAVIEKQVGMKVVNLDDYDKMNKDIKEMKSKLQQKENELKGKDSKIADITKERDAYLSSSGIDKFCGECTWAQNGNISCEARAAYMLETWGDIKSLGEAKLRLLKDFPKECTKKRRNLR